MDVEAFSGALAESQPLCQVFQSVSVRLCAGVRQLVDNVCLNASLSTQPDGDLVGSLETIIHLHALLMGHIGGKTCCSLPPVADAASQCEIVGGRQFSRSGREIRNPYRHMMGIDPDVLVKKEEEGEATGLGNSGAESSEDSPERPAGRVAHAPRGRGRPRGRPPKRGRRGRPPLNLGPLENIFSTVNAPGAQVEEYQTYLAAVPINNTALKDELLTVENMNADVISASVAAIEEATATTGEPVESVEELVQPVSQDPSPPIPGKVVSRRGSRKPTVKKKDYESLAPFKFFCSLCSFKSKRRSHYDKHQSAHQKASTPLLQCSQCSFKTLRLTHLRRHETTHSATLLQCKLCRYCTHSTTLMTKHYRTRHQGTSRHRIPDPDPSAPLSKLLRCEHCTYSTRQRHHFVRHAKCHARVAGSVAGGEGEQVGAYQCTWCAYNSARKEHFIRHLESVHSNRRPYLCDYCGRGFKRHDALKQHHQCHLDQRLREYPWTCRFCNKKFRSQAHLVDHMRALHSLKREFLCEICGASFKTRGVQRKHVQTIHRNPRAHTCEHCDKRFNTRYCLQRHLRTHDAVLGKWLDSGVDGADLASLPDGTNLQITEINASSDVTQEDTGVDDATGLQLGGHTMQSLHIQPMALDTSQIIANGQVIAELQTLPLSSQLHSVADGDVAIHQVAAQLESQAAGEQVALQHALVQASDGTLQHALIQSSDGTLQQALVRTSDGTLQQIVQGSDRVLQALVQDGDTILQHALDKDESLQSALVQTSEGVTDATTAYLYLTSLPTSMAE